jgi:AcrR family transcriptional regulator
MDASFHASTQSEAPMPYRTTRKMLHRKHLRRRPTLQAAVNLFALHDYQATTVPMIIKAVRTGAGTFYQYFAGKDDIFAAALQCFAQDIAPALRKTLSNSSGPHCQLRRLLHRLVLLLTASSTGARILLAESSGAGGVRLDRVRHDVIDSQARLLAQVLACATSSIDVIHAALISQCCIGSAYQSVRHWLELPPSQRPSAEVLAVTVTEFSLRGVTPFLPEPVPEISYGDPSANSFGTNPKSGTLDPVAAWLLILWQNS